MSIPSFNQIMCPLLKIVQNGNDYRLSDVVGPIADLFSLSKPEREELLPSGRRRKFDDRVAWAKTYLKEAGLLEYLGQGGFRITERGKVVLGEQLQEITTSYLRQFPEFRAFVSRTRQNHNSQGANAVTTQTPAELLEVSHQNLKRQLAHELLDQVKAASPRFFEQLVVDLALAMGYGGSRADAGRAIGGTGDKGVDGIINEDRLGLDVMYLQAKRWQDTVGEPVVHQLYQHDNRRESYGVAQEAPRLSS